jgi:hypothetical protein
LIDLRFPGSDRFRIRPTAVEPALRALGLREEVVDLVG